VPPAASRSGTLRSTAPASSTALTAARRGESPPVLVVSFSTL
jgi:hypothetical protein